MRMMRNFREMLGWVSRGEFSRHLDQQMTDCLTALEQMPGEKGKAKITIDVIFNYELGRVDVDVASKVKLPETAKFVRTPFWAIDGALSLEHPNQSDMFPARAVATGTDD